MFTVDVDGNVTCGTINNHSLDEFALTTHTHDDYATIDDLTNMSSKIGSINTKLEHLSYTPDDDNTEGSFTFNRAVNFNKAITVQTINGAPFESISIVGHTHDDLEERISTLEQSSGQGENDDRYALKDHTHEDLLFRTECVALEQDLRDEMNNINIYLDEICRTVTERVNNHTHNEFNDTVAFRNQTDFHSQAIFHMELG